MAKSYRAVRGQMLGSLESWSCAWSWLGDAATPSPVAAGVEGALELGSDDFVIVELDGDLIVRALGSDGSELADWGPDDISEIAESVGLRAA